MKKSQKIILAFLGLILVVAASGLVAKKYVDQKAAKQERVVVTSNALAEIFAKLDINLVGVPKTKATLPKRYQNVAKVGSPMAPSLEKIAELNPSQVYAVSTLKSKYSAAFKKQAIPVTFLKLDSVGQLEASVKSLGNKYQKQKEANRFVQEIESAKSHAKKRQTKKKPKVLILMGVPGSGYMIMTDKSYIGSLVTLAGGENIYKSSKAYLTPSNDSLAQQNPDVILRLEHALPSVTLPQFKMEFKQNAFWSKMDAVKNKRVYDLQQPVFNASANVNAAKALRQVSQWLFPGK